MTKGSVARYPSYDIIFYMGEGPPQFVPPPDTTPPSEAPESPLQEAMAVQDSPDQVETGRFEIEEIDEKRAFFGGRARRVNESPEEFRREREQAWAEQQAVEGSREATTKEAAHQTERTPEAWKQAQDSAIQNVLEYLKGGGPLRGEFTEEEQKLLSRMSAEVGKAARENPDAAAVNLDFSGNPDAYRIWSGMINRMAEQRGLRMAEVSREQPRVESERGLPTQPGAESAAEPVDPQQAKAQEIKAAFERIAGSIGKSAEAKLREYDERIRAALDGRPLKPGDTADQLRRDFKAMARRDWDPNSKAPS